MAKRYQREVIRSRKSKKNRQHNGQNKKYRGTNNIVHDKIALTMRYTLVVLVLIFVFHIWSLYCYFTYVIVICFAKPPHIAKDEIPSKFVSCQVLLKQHLGIFRTFLTRRNHNCKQVDIHTLMNMHQITLIYTYCNHCVLHIYSQTCPCRHLY